MRFYAERNGGINANTPILINKNGYSIKEILKDNFIDYTDIESVNSAQKIKIDPIELSLSVSVNTIDTLYFLGGKEFFSCVFENGEHIDIAGVQDILLIDETGNYWTTVNKVKINTDRVLFLIDGYLVETKLLSKTSIGLEPAWMVHRYLDKSAVLKNGLIIN